MVCDTGPAYGEALPVFTARTEYRYVPLPLKSSRLVKPAGTVPAVVALPHTLRLAFHVSRRTSKPVSFVDASSHVTVAEPSASFFAATLVGSAGGGKGTAGVVTEAVIEYAELPALLYARTR